MHLSFLAGPLKRVKKRYLNNAGLPIPKRTLYRKEARGNKSAGQEKDESSTGVKEQQHAEALDVNEDVPTPDPAQDHDKSFQDYSEIEDELIQNENGGPEDLISRNRNTYFNVSSEESNHESDLDSESNDSLNFSTESSSENELSESSSSDESNSESDEEQIETQCHERKYQSFTVLQLQSLAIIAFLLRHNLTGVAVSDLISLLKVIYPDSSLGSLKYEELFQVIDKVNFKVCHYCHICHKVFPPNRDIFKCETPSCPGFRYRGGHSAQTKANREAWNFFLLADIKTQLKYILEQDGLLEKILSCKKQAKASKSSQNSSLKDITDGSFYRLLLEEGQFLAGDNCISGIFNTDGIPLYSSAKVKLWPIFIAINEIPLCQRFARDNMVLAGIWQGKASPPFLQYMNAFGEEMCSLYEGGIPVSVGGSLTSVKLGIFLGIVDLQAKGYILNMTMHNGESGCSTCEEPGKTVKQGKGHSRCYPYRKSKDRYPLRDSGDIKCNIGPKAAGNKRIKGIIGLTGLASMPWFDVVLGIVPDYMHGVLMGVTKTLLLKWFSPSQSKQPFFVGNHFRAISKRLMTIKPPDYIERLPRDLEKHFAHFKATELQAWLLYYALPCLSGYLPAKYLQHFAHLSEGIHLLLKDCITEPDLVRAEALLNIFYRDFCKLYGEGGCGLNVHNVGAHLVFYVRLWGPLFAWSCFGFEDWNAVLLQAVHGTGDVTKQILCHIHAQLQLKSLFLRMPENDTRGYISKLIKQTRQWKITQTAQDCSISGAVVNLSDLPGNELELVKTVTGEQDTSQLSKALRVQYGQEKLYAKDYKRMKKRVCYVALTKKGDIVSIRYFIYSKKLNSVFALAQVVNLANDCFIFSEAGHHILKVNETQDIVVIPICEIQEKLFFLKMSETLKFVIRMPNVHGHGLLK